MSKRDKVVKASVNERTSKRVAAIAGKVLRICATYSPKHMALAAQHMPLVAPDLKEAVSVAEIKALAASVLTQAPNKGIVRATARPKKAGRVGRRKK